MQDYNSKLPRSESFFTYYTRFLINFFTRALPNISSPSDCIFFFTFKNFYDMVWIYISWNNHIDLISYRTQMFKPVLIVLWFWIKVNKALTFSFHLLNLVPRESKLLTSLLGLFQELRAQDWRKAFTLLGQSYGCAEIILQLVLQIHQS